ncbi:MAG: acetyl-CoA carboxylase biotin carboxyl carrier protein [Armatimonadota bacterium]|nr:acetyl-CoA carboxylase biotin carboxyl carrier protein [Armatimonadota bacterium]MDR7426057.1 acetyl-CoA carboxylase biotin carboxyl carrier protein [Armatimonadota bacterium]MDR7464710.1 acetyl-CoA carboxylase biotin carboxyl carrier protein [Armatimonadota bacterium]MDR7469056.1 acetyl-CoA carboxylase biotin carboxyl carrier protein [Armatimonadota bacterium]MDR7474258.1 acetyl-CoA carboxylase biotin carboxyl carrier protein [Armatimonadota bacterium]
MEHSFDLEEIRALLQIAAEADITELTVESPRLKVTIKKAAGRTEVPTPSAARPPRPASPEPPAPALSPAGTAVSEEELAAAGEVVPDHLKTITAPMVGTFYRAPSPDAPPFIREGDVVQAGQTVCIIEAMKLFNEIQSEVSGRVVRILSENGAPVEYGQPLVLLEPLP